MVSKQEEFKIRLEAESKEREYEKWKKRAVEEFPDIGVAGSRFNQHFLLEAKKMI